jgi:hypothetical protein
VIDLLLHPAGRNFQMGLTHATDRAVIRASTGTGRTARTRSYRELISVFLVGGS